MQRRKLPIGIQTFRQIRGEDCYYVDKTGYARRLANDAGKHYFLSRPRRFGKSLFLDTLKELFEGSEDLFRGLAVHDAWDWSKRHPAVRLSFAAGNFRRPGHLHAAVMRQLAAAERRYELAASEDPTPAGRFADLLERLSARAGRRVVVLVDEYDKPILDGLDEPEPARVNRDDLRGLYGVIKDCDACVELTFITGVSKFSRLSLFSDLNNLTDLTLDPDYAALCGYTEADLESVFAPELPGLDRNEIRSWYNGYNWQGTERVYNPYDILHLFRSREFAPHWFRTGAPKFLVETLARRGVGSIALEDVRASDARLDAFDVDAVGTEALLFQTGYLTILGAERRGGRTLYRLGYPNREVRQCLNESLLDHLAPDPRREEHGARLYDLLEAGDAAGLEAPIRALFAGIPADWHRRNDIARFEGYYASVFYSYFVALGLDVVVEDAGSGGRLDMAVRHGRHAYLFEFKMTARSGGGEALAQIRKRDYAGKYRTPGRVVHLIGVEFSAAARNVVAFETEPA